MEVFGVVLEYDNKAQTAFIRLKRRADMEDRHRQIGWVVCSWCRKTADEIAVKVETHIARVDALFLLQMDLDGNKIGIAAAIKRMTSRDFMEIGFTKEVHRWSLASNSKHNKSIGMGWTGKRWARMG